MTPMTLSGSAISAESKTNAWFLQVLITNDWIYYLKLIKADNPFCLGVPRTQVFSQLTQNLSILLKFSNIVFWQRKASYNVYNTKLHVSQSNVFCFQQIFSIISSNSFSLQHNYFDTYLSKYNYFEMQTTLDKSVNITQYKFIVKIMFKNQWVNPFH